MYALDTGIVIVWRDCSKKLKTNDSIVQIESNENQESVSDSQDVKVEGENDQKEGNVCF